MKKILMICLLSMLFVSCGDDAPLWVNFYDPDGNAEERSGICKAVECGEIDYKGMKFVCGECADTEFCSTIQKCVEKCGENSCGVYENNTYYGIKSIDCGKCDGDDICATDNTCADKERICMSKKCGNVQFLDYLSVQHSVNCGTCTGDQYCTVSQVCAKKADACTGKCGTVTVETDEGDIELECGTCTGEFAYCGVDNKCAEACIDMECGTQTVGLEIGGNKIFECGDCGGAKEYCDDNYKCVTACVGKECGEESVTTFDGGSDVIMCGTCTDPDYCDAAQKCKTGTKSGDYIYDSNVVVDTVLKLMWQRAEAQGSTWADADTLCNAASTDGFDDWRLPDISELRSTIAGCTAALTCGVIDTCIDSTCSNADCNGCANNAGSGPQGLYLAPDIWTYTGDANGRFWSASTVPDKVDSNWFIRFSNASVAYNWNGNEYLVRCVREVK